MPRRKINFHLRFKAIRGLTFKDVLHTHFGQNKIKKGKEQKSF